MVGFVLRLILLLIPLQLIILIFGYQPTISRNVDALEYQLLAFIILLLFFSPALYLFRRDNLFNLPKSYSKLIFSPTNFSRVTAFLMICIAAIVTFLMPESVNKTLNGSQDIENIGILFKISTTICPALAFSVMTIRPNSASAIVSLGAAFFVSLQMSILFLTKQPLVPYILMLFYVLSGSLKAVTLKVKLASIIALIGLLFVFQLIYSERVSGDYSFTFVTLIEQLIFRVILIPELVVIIASDTVPLFTANMSEFFIHVTDNVYGYDSKYIGIAPGYAGFFILNYGYLFGYLFSLFLMFFVSRIIIVCKNDHYFGRILYFMISIDLLHLITDGNPSIITSTSGSKFFYALILGVCVIFLKEMIYKRSGYLKNS